jgi:hypothetical protein
LGCICIRNGHGIISADHSSTQHQEDQHTYRFFYGNSFTASLYGAAFNFMVVDKNPISNGLRKPTLLNPLTRLLLRLVEYGNSWREEDDREKDGGVILISPAITEE